MAESGLTCSQPDSVLIILRCAGGIIITCGKEVQLRGRGFPRVKKAGIGGLMQACAKRPVPTTQGGFHETQANEVVGNEVDNKQLTCTLSIE